MFRFGFLFLAIVVADSAVGQETTPRAEQKIRDALQGDSPKPTGDGMLDDVIDLVRRRGSILDGSVLDSPEMRPKAAASGLVSQPPHSIESRALAAEQLLRAARLLMHAGDVDECRRDLVARMRSEAVKLLTPTNPAKTD